MGSNKQMWHQPPCIVQGSSEYIPALRGGSCMEPLTHPVQKSNAHVLVDAVDRRTGQGTGVGQSTPFCPMT